MNGGSAAPVAEKEEEEEEKLPEGNYDNQPCRNCNLQLVIRSIFSLPSIHHGTNTRGSMRRRWRRDTGGTAAMKARPRHGGDGDRAAEMRRAAAALLDSKSRSFFFVVATCVPSHNDFFFTLIRRIRL